MLEEAKVQIKGLDKENDKLFKKTVRLSNNRNVLMAANRDLQLELDKTGTKNPLNKARIAGQQTRNRMDYQENKIKDEVKTTQLNAQATVEVVTNQGKDILNSIVNIGKSLFDKGTSGIEKVANVATSVVDAEFVTKKVTSKEGKEDAQIKVTNDYMEKIKHYEDEIKKANNVLSDPDASTKRIQHAKKYISDANKQIDALRQKMRGAKK